MNILLCILQRYFALFKPKHTPKNEINNWTEWQIFTWYPGVRFMSSYICLWLVHYCKRCYFRVTKFSRLAAQKHIRGLLNSRWADAHLSFWYCTMLTSFNEWYNYMYVCNWQHKNKAGLIQTWVYNPFASTHMVNTQLLRVQNVHTKYCILQIFSRVFWIRACWICAKYAKINVPRIFPLLQ